MLSEFVPAGRLTRGAFWLRHLTTVPIGLWIVVAAGDVPGAPYDVPLAAALVLMLVSVWSRRLHDRGRSAWWLLAMLVPVLGALFLIVECAFRGTAPTADRFGAAPGVRADYLTVAETQRATP